MRRKKKEKKCQALPCVSTHTHRKPSITRKLKLQISTNNASSSSFSHKLFQLAVCSSWTSPPLVLFDVLRCVAKKIWKRDQSKPHILPSVAKKNSQTCFFPYCIISYCSPTLAVGNQRKPASLFGTWLEILRYESLLQFSNTNVLSRLPYLLRLCVSSTESCRSTIIL